MRLIRPTRVMPGAPARANRGVLARRDDLRFRVSAPASGRWSLIALVGVSLVLGACSSSEVGTNVTGIIGGTSTVAISTNTGTTSVLEGQTLILTASVGGDLTYSNGAPYGVKWVLNGPGSLTAA